MRAAREGREREAVAAQSQTPVAHARSRKGGEDVAQARWCKQNIWPGGNVQTLTYLEST